MAIFVDALREKFPRKGTIGRSRGRAGGCARACEALESRTLLSASVLQPVDDATAIFGQRADTGDVFLLKSNGTNGFTNQFLFNQAEDIGLARFAVEDFNNDGLDDVVALDPLGELTVSLADGMGGANTPTQWGQVSTNVTWTGPLVGDFNNDGNADVALLSSTNAWVIGLSNGVDGFSFSVFGRLSNNVGWNRETAKVGDFNNDGNDDIVILSSSGAVVVGLSNGAKFNFSVFKLVSTNVSWDALVVGDFNNDGNDDAAIFSNTGAWVLLTSTGTSFNATVATRWSTNVLWTDIFVADLDDDGDDDLLAFSSNSLWYAGISDGSSFANTVFAQWSPNVTWDCVSIGDFNGDFMTDIVGRALHSGDWYVGLGNGSNAVASKWGNWTTSTTWRGGVAGDFISLPVM
jgi:hypothetical protein